MIKTTPKHIVAVCALVTNDTNEILLVKTERRGWEVPGGQVEQGETLTQALLRETYEESGVTIEIGKLCVVNTNLSKIIIVFGFHARYVAGELAPRPGEIVDVQWVKPEAALSMIAHPVNLQRVKDMLEADGQIVYRAYTLNPYQIIETRAGF